MIDRPDNVNIYVLYAAADEELKRELEGHLSTLQRLGYIDVWHDGLIEAGADRSRVVAEYLRRAHIVLLLISANFLSPDCYSQYESELRLAYERQSRGEVKIVPVILRHCLWQMDILARLTPLPRSGHPVRSSHWESQDRAFQEIALELQRLAGELKEAWRRREAPAPPAPAGPPAPPDGAGRETGSGGGVEDGAQDGLEALIGQLLGILCTLREEEGVQRFRAIAHRSLFPGGVLEPGFRRNNFAPARERGRLYRRPALIVSRQPTGRRHLGRRSEREDGEEVKYTIARADDLGGFAGHVRVFFPADGGAPSISGLSL